jgi:hypothetical protein
MEKLTIELCQKCYCLHGKPREAQVTTLHTERVRPRLLATPPT